MILLTKKDDIITMSSNKRIKGLHTALKSIYKNKIEGDVVECGIYFGGNIIIAKVFFDSLNEKNKKFYAYDTFEGMTKPGNNDPEEAHQTWKNKSSCLAHFDQVIKEFEKHNILDDRIIFVKGDVNLTLQIEKNLPKKISLLRLDTDWYESTKIELEVLFDRLVPGGFLIIDDYGHWTGCKKATDEFFGKKFVNKNFIKLDYTGIMLQK